MFRLFFSHLQVCAIEYNKYKYKYNIYFIYWFLPHTPEDGYGIAETCSVILGTLCIHNTKIQSSR
jgi:hypothetical protein